MRRWRIWVLGALAVAVGLGGLAYHRRFDLMLAAVRFKANREEIAPNQPVRWQQGPAQAVLPPEKRPPNIIFILFDDLGINDLSTFGGGVAGGRVPTPNIDKLASQGAIFTQSYAGHSSCAPSRAELMTGRYSTRTGFEYTPTPVGMSTVVTRSSNHMRPDLPPAEYDAAADAELPLFDKQGLPPEEVTIAEVLKARGYHTVHIGKWHLGSAPGFRPNDQGFDESLVMMGGLHLPENDPNVVNAKIDFDPIDKFLWASQNFVTSYNFGKKFAPGGYLTDYWADESLKVIEANRNRPFFLYLANWGVHSPLQATRQDYEAVGDIKPHRLRVYAAMVRSLDRSVGRIMAKLDEEGLADNTMVVISSDNGGAGYIGLPQVNAPYRGFKLTFFEGGIRVPLFARWPAQIPAGTRVDLPVSHVDYFPTIAAATGAALPQGVAIDGRNLLPAAERRGQIERPDAPLYWNSGYYRVVRAGNWKLQVNGKQNKVWLYDLASDPTEKVNLATARPEKVAQLQALLADHQRGRKPPLYPSTINAAVMVDKSLADKFRSGDEFVYVPN